MTLALAAAAGVLIGLSLGALGGGGSILAVPVLVYLLGQSPSAATTGSLLVVGVASLVSALAAWRSGTVLLGRGVAFGGVALGGAWLGTQLAASVPESVLLAAFSALMLLVAGVMFVRVLRAHRSPDATHRRPRVDDPIITISPSFHCSCPRALQVLLAATGVGLLTGFLGVGGGFLVVPALVLALGLPMATAAGTSLVVITVTSTAALLLRLHAGLAPDWSPVLALAAASVVGGVLGTRIARRVDNTRLTVGFAALVMVVGAATASQSLPALA